MEDMFMRWIQETIAEFNKAKVDVNYFKMRQMKILLYELRTLRDKLAKSMS